MSSCVAILAVEAMRTARDLFAAQIRRWPFVSVASRT